LLSFMIRISSTQVFSPTFSLNTGQQLKQDSVGPITQYVKDSAIILRAIAGISPLEPPESI
jgi:Asp-tRNA(Asn)/Glu-tRNA(Gln) amidotransferase A subunit family amidase